MSLIKRLIWQIRKPIAKTLDSPTKKEGISNLLAEGFLDSYRHLYPDQTGAYSWWSSRAVPVVGMWGGGLIILLFQMFLPLPFVRQPSIPRLRDQIVVQWVFLWCKAKRNS